MELVIRKDLSLIKCNSTRLLHNKELVKSLQVYADVLLEHHYCDLLLGTVNFAHKYSSFAEAWAQVNPNIDILKQTLLQQFNVTELWISVELHRSAKGKKAHSLQGRPHLHFLLGFASWEFTGHSCRSLKELLSEHFSDINLKKVSKSKKSYLTVFRYLLKETSFKDSSSLMKASNGTPIVTSCYLASPHLITSWKLLIPKLVKHFGNKFSFQKCLNLSCFHLHPSASNEEVVSEIYNQVFRQQDLKYARGTVFKKVKGIKYAYTPHILWSEFHVDFVRRFHTQALKLKTIFRKTIALSSALEIYLPMFNRQHDFLETEDIVFQFSTHVKTKKDQFKPPVRDFHIRKHWPTPFPEFKALEFDRWLIDNNIDIHKFKVVIGSLLRVRKYERDILVPLLTGVSGAGKSLVARQYANLVGAEYVGQVSQSQVFAFAGLTETILAVMDDIDWSQNTEQIKILLEGAKFKTDRKHRSRVDVPAQRVIITSQTNFTKILNSPDRSAYKGRVEEFKFEVKLTNYRAKELIQEFPAFVIEANERFLQWEQRCR